MATPNVWDERLETPGYEETWNEGETTSGSATITDDNASSDAGNPSNWGDYCLKIVTTAGSEVAKVSHDNSGILAYPVLYFRIEIVVTSEDLANFNKNYVVWLYQDNPYKDAFVLFIDQDGSGNFKFKMGSFHTGSQVDYVSFDTINLDQRYLIEGMWNATGDTWAWKIDGVAQSNDQDNSDPVESDGTLSGDHAVEIDHWEIGAAGAEAAATYYLDLFGLDTTGWIGAEPEPGLSFTTKEDVVLVLS